MSINMIGSARRSRSYGFTHGSMLLQPDRAASAKTGSKTRNICRFLVLILQAYRGVSPPNVTSASEEDRDAQSPFKVMGGLLFAEEVDIKKVIAKIYMQRN